MRGRKPKDPSARRRRNKASTAAVLELGADAPKRKAPPLPHTLGDRRTHSLTRKWWTIIWKSPMASRWMDADVEGLYLVAILRNEFFTRPTTSLAAEIRQQESRFGLDVLSRRRLDWRILGPQTPAEAPSEEPEEEDAPPPPDQVDPRTVLRAVK